MRDNILRIAFISDLHYDLFPNSECPERRGEFMPAILAAMVKKLNTQIKPDAVLAGGDLINAPGAEEAERLTAITAEILALLDMPCIAIRGNHDICREQFVRYFPFHQYYDMDFLRIVCFDDKETPGYNAVRSDGDLQKMREFAGFDGVKFSFQHTPLTPPACCMYSYENAEDILALMRECNYKGALSGHYHVGIELFQDNGLQFFVQNAMCEKPFSASLLHISRSGIEKTETIYGTDSF